MASPMSLFCPIQSGMALVSRIGNNPSHLIDIASAHFKLIVISFSQYCEHHQRNWDGHEKQWKKAFPSPEASHPQPPPGARVKVAGVKRPKEGGWAKMHSSLETPRAIPSYFSILFWLFGHLQEE